MRASALLLIVTLSSLVDSRAGAQLRGNAFGAQGRVEGASEPLELGFTLAGRVGRVLVDEGDTITAGQALMELECSEERPAARAATARLQSTQSAYERARRGARDEERAVALAREAAATAALTEAKAHFTRIDELVAQGGLASRREWDDSRRVLDMARAALDVARAELQLAESDLLPEEDEKWQAEIAAAREGRKAAEAREAQCTLKSPIVGLVLKRHVLAGEIVTTMPQTTALTVVDHSKIRVRVEVDERDALTVRREQAVTVSTPDGSSSYIGHVIWISPTMGRKQVRGTDPAEKSDRDVREALVELAADADKLPIGLRVNVAFQQ